VVSGYSSYTQNTDIVDGAGTYWDLYMVVPQLAVTGPSGPTTISGPPSRPFYAWQPLYDVQISMLLDNFRKSYIKDVPVPQTDSTIVTESSGSGVLPFMTDSATTRFFLSFLPGDDPVKIIPDTVRVWKGTSKSTATPLVPYQDFAPSEYGGYIDFATAPPTTDYLRVEYETVRVPNDDIRGLLLNGIADLSAHGINGYQIDTSNNLLYLESPLPNRDLYNIVCNISYKNYLNEEVVKSFSSAEAWKDGKFEYTADPSRSIRAATTHIAALNEQLRHDCNGYILASRNYIGYGEFESFFDMTGVLPVYALIVAGTNLAGAMGYWI